MWSVNTSIRWHGKDNSKDREKIAKEIAETSDSIRKKCRALKTDKMEEGIALERHFKPIIETNCWNKLLKTLLNPPRILLWLKHSFREKMRNRNLKQNDLMFCTTILYRPEKSIKNRTIYFERSVWNNTTRWFMTTLPPSKKFPRL